MDYELYHHGVKGQKWYVRRFQPYPKGKKPKGAKEIGLATQFGTPGYSAKAMKKAAKSNKALAKASKKADRIIAKMEAKQIVRDAKQQAKDSLKVAKKGSVKTAQTADFKSNQPKPNSESSISVARKPQPAKKKLSEMTDEELKKEINRLQLEKQYTDLFKSVNPPPTKVSKGKNAVKSMMGEIMTSAVKDVGKQVAKYALGTAINKLSGKPIIKLGDDKKKKKTDKKDNEDD